MSDRFALRHANGRFAGRWNVDPYDPRGWDFSETTRALYLDDSGEVAALVDAVDFDWASRWLWGITFNSSRSKIYATRNTNVPGTNRQQKFYLHKEVLRRFKPQTDPLAHICDHMDGDSLNCRRSNLRWATPAENGLNRFGAYHKQMQLFPEVRS